MTKLMQEKHVAEPLPVEMTALEPPVSRENGLLKIGSIVSAFGLLIIGVVMLVMALLTPIEAGRRIVEIVLSSGNLVGGMLLLRDATNKKHAQVSISLWPGEIALLPTFIYLGIAMSAFQLGLTSYHDAVIQLIAVLSGFVLGTVALALSGTTRGKSAHPKRKIAPAASLRDGVILIVGTILLAIALGQISGAALKPTQWSWISFLGITIPGMLLLIAREGIKRVTENWGRRSEFTSVLRLLATDSLLIVGLAVMLYGSYNNLTLGMNGYAVGFKGNTDGLILWVAAALFLLLVRGFYKLVFSQGGRVASRLVVSQLLYVVAIVAFIDGERSALSGKSPLLSIGGAAPAVILILSGALLVLVLGRVAVQKVS